MIHEVEIRSLDDYRQEIKIDGQEIPCSGYELFCHVDAVPTIAFIMPVQLFTDMHLPMEVAIKNLKEIAKMMDYDTFEEFCQIWHETHPPLAPKLIVDDLVDA